MALRSSAPCWSRRHAKRIHGLARPGVLALKGGGSAVHPGSIRHQDEIVDIIFRCINIRFATRITGATREPVKRYADAVVANSSSALLVFQYARKAVRLRSFHSTAISGWWHGQRPSFTAEALQRTPFVVVAVHRGKPRFSWHSEKSFEYNAYNSPQVNSNVENIEESDFCAVRYKYARLRTR
jgi:hypothetical protein